MVLKFEMTFNDVNIGQKFFPFRDEENENMDEWDEEKLEEVVKKKHGSEKANATDIVRIFWRNIFHRLNLRIVQNSPIT